MLSNFRKVSIGENISSVISNFVWRIERLSDSLDDETIESNRILDNVKPALVSPIEIEPSNIREWNTEFYNFLYSFLRNITKTDQTTRTILHDGFPIEIKIYEQLIDWEKIEKNQFVERLYSHLKLWILSQIGQKIYRKASPALNEEGKRIKWKDLFFLASGNYQHYGHYNEKDMYRAVQANPQGYRLIYRLENVQTFVPTNSEELQKIMGIGLTIVKDGVGISKATYRFNELFEGQKLKEIESIVDKMELIPTWNKWNYFEPNYYG